MSGTYIAIAISTAATLLAIILLVLRSRMLGRRLALNLLRRWITTSRTTSGFVLTALLAIAIASMGTAPSHFPAQSIHPGAAGNGQASSGQDSVHTADNGSDTTQPLDALRKYASGLDNGSESQETAATTPSKESNRALPDVDTMIAKLASRLQDRPDDIKGWQMLAWSYLNTGHPEEAVKAYEAALKLKPDDAEIKKGLEAAKAASKTKD